MFIEVDSDYNLSQKQFVNINNIVHVQEIDDNTCWIYTKATASSGSQLRVKGSYYEIKKKIQECIIRS